MGVKSGEDGSEKVDPSEVSQPNFEYEQALKRAQEQADFERGSDFSLSYSADKLAGVSRPGTSTYRDDQSRVDAVEASVGKD